MNKDIISALRIVRTAITYCPSRAYANKLARIAFYLEDQVWA